MNRLAGKKIAVVGNKSQGSQKVNNGLKHKDLEILDTPGILWPKFEDETVALKLALILELSRISCPIWMRTIFGISIISKNIIQKSWLNA